MDGGDSAVNAGNDHSPRDRLRRERGLVGRLVGDAAVDARVPRVQEHLALRGPRAVPQAEFEAGHSYDPVRRGAEHGDLRGGNWEGLKKGASVIG